MAKMAEMDQNKTLKKKKQKKWMGTIRGRFDANEGENIRGFF